MSRLFAFRRRERGLPMDRRPAFYLIRMVTLDRLDSPVGHRSVARDDLADFCSADRLRDPRDNTLARRASSSEDARASEIEAYKLQLNELDREEDRGTLGKVEAQQTRAEVSRRLLRASRQSVEVPPKKPRSS